MKHGNSYKQRHVNESIMNFCRGVVLIDVKSDSGYIITDFLFHKYGGKAKGPCVVWLVIVARQTGGSVKRNNS